MNTNISTSLDDYLHPGWPVSARSNESVERTHAIVMQDGANNHEATL